MAYHTSGQSFKNLENICYLKWIVLQYLLYEVLDFLVSCTLPRWCSSLAIHWTTQVNHKIQVWTPLLNSMIHFYIGRLHGVLNIQYIKFAKY